MCIRDSARPTSLHRTLVPQVWQLRSWHVRRARPGEQQRVPSNLWPEVPTCGTATSRQSEGGCAPNADYTSQLVQCRLDIQRQIRQRRCAFQEVCWRTKAFKLDPQHEDGRTQNNAGSHQRVLRSAYLNFVCLSDFMPNGYESGPPIMCRTGIKHFNFMPVFFEGHYRHKIGSTTV